MWPLQRRRVVREDGVYLLTMTAALPLLSGLLDIADHLLDVQIMVLRGLFQVISDDVTGLVALVGLSAAAAHAHGARSLGCRSDRLRERKQDWGRPASLLDSGDS